MDRKVKLGLIGMGGRGIGTLDGVLLKLQDTNTPLWKSPIESLKIHQIISRGIMMNQYLNF